MDDLNRNYGSNTEHVTGFWLKVYLLDGKSCDEPKYLERQVWGNSVDPDQTEPAHDIMVFIT